MVGKRQMLAEIKARAKEFPEETLFAKNERKAMKKAREKPWGEPFAGIPIVAAWIITVPATALLPALLFKTIILLGGRYPGLDSWRTIGPRIASRPARACDTVLPASHRERPHEPDKRNPAPHPLPAIAAEPCLG